MPAPADIKEARDKVANARTAIKAAKERQRILVDAGLKDAAATVAEEIRMAEDRVNQMARALGV